MRKLTNVFEIQETCSTNRPSKISSRERKEGNRRLTGQNRKGQYLQAKEFSLLSITTSALKLYQYMTA